MTQGKDHHKLHTKKQYTKLIHHHWWTVITMDINICNHEAKWLYEGASKSFQTGRLERELQMVQLSATRYSYITILWVSLVSFATITLCVASQHVFVVVVYFITNSVWKLLDIPLYCKPSKHKQVHPWGSSKKVNSIYILHLLSRYMQCVINEADISYMVDW
jgi:hypothetical protein